MAKITVTKQREKIVNSTMEKIIEILEENKIIYDRTKDFQTLTFECGEIEKSDGVKCNLYGSIKFTLHKDDFNLDDAIFEFEDKIKAKEEREKILEEKHKKALEDKAKREQKKKEMEEKKKREKEEKGE